MISVLTPLLASADAVTCFCCTLRLEGWKPNDDPIARHVEAAAQGRSCAWLDKIVTKPEQVTVPVSKRAAPLWDHTKTPRKCGQCRKVFSSGNQFHIHRREAHPVIRRGVKTLRRQLNMLNPKPKPTRSGSLFLGAHRVTKAKSRARVPKRERLIVTYVTL